MSRNIWQKYEGFLHFLMAVLVATVTFLVSPEAKQYIPDELKVKLVEAGIAFALAYAFLRSVSVRHKLVGLKGAVDSAKRELAGLTQRIIEDERIIFARSTPPRDIQVIGVEDPGPVPGQLPKPISGGEQWGLSISILRFDRMQDLLFSGDYIDHFVRLSRAATCSSRILIVNNKPRCRSAVLAFLHLSKGLGIATYIYTKREYYAMLDTVRRTTSRSGFKSFPRILDGNPDLSIAVEAFEAFVPKAASPTGAVAKESDFLIRFLDENRGFQSLHPRKADGAVVGPMAAILDLAMHEPRLGAEAFVRIIDSSGGRPENRWTSEHITNALQPFTKKVSP